MSKRMILILTCIIVFLLFSGVVLAAAPPGGYAPSETLDPDCSPGETDCTVNTSLAVPQGTVIFFNGSSCPTGYAEVTDARGRYMVGLPSGGSIGSTTGSALSDLENRPVGEHNHTLRAKDDDGDFNEPGSSSLAKSENTYKDESADTSMHSSSILNSGSVAGTNAPYIQFLVCEKS